MAQEHQNNSSAKIAAEGAPTTAAAVANAFLDIQEQDNSSVYPYIDQMKLQKLVFYAHAWWLAYKNAPLFGDDVEAWPWGPVVRDVYSNFKEFGRKPIKGKRISTVILDDSGNKPKLEWVSPEAPNKEIMEFLKKVWESHKSWTGVQLSNATHAIGEPWTIIKDAYKGVLDSKPRIPNTLIHDVFKKKLAKNN